LEEKTLEDFFKSESPSRFHKSETVDSNKEESRLKKPSKINLSDVLKKLFSFDAYTDLKDPTSVLYRRNYCIKNINSLVNVVFLLFSLVGISKSNYIITIVFFIIMTALSNTIGKMLKKKKDDYNHQVIIMYLQSFFVFFLSVVLYIKIYLGFTLSGANLTNTQFSITQAAYFLMFFSLIIMALYQEPKLLRTMFIWSFLIITIINLSLVHPDLYYHADDIVNLFNYVFKENTDIITDIILRTLVLLVYFVALYSSVSLSRSINDKRTQEMNKRIGVETNLKEVVSSLFDAVKVYNAFKDPLLQELSSRKIRAVAKEIGSSLAFDNLKLNELVEYSSIHTEKIRELSLNDISEIKEDNFNVVLLKTNLASKIMRRLEISKEAEDIVYSIFNGVEIDKGSHQKIDINEEIILISEVYDILRSDRTYKRALNHERAIDLILNAFKGLFSDMVLIRLQKFNIEIKKAYERI